MSCSWQPSYADAGVRMWQLSGAALRQVVAPTALACAASLALPAAVNLRKSLTCHAIICADEEQQQGSQLRQDCAPHGCPSAALGTLSLLSVWLPSALHSVPRTAARPLLPCHCTNLPPKAPLPLRPSPAMAGTQACWAAALGCLLGLGLVWGQLPATEVQEAASSAAQLLQALNRTQGHGRSVTITLQGWAQPPPPPPPTGLNRRTPACRIPALQSGACSWRNALCGVARKRASDAPPASLSG